MERPPTIAMVVGAFGGLIALTGSCLAQTITVQMGNQNQSPQNPQASQIQPPLPRLGVPRSIITTPTTTGPTSAPLTSGPARSSAIAGRGLPGHAVGNSLKSPDGCPGLISQLHASSGDWSFVLRPVD